MVVAAAAMGGRLTRVFRTFNVESRARREISKEKPTPAPRHPTSQLDELAGGCRPRGAAPEGLRRGAVSVGPAEGRATAGGKRALGAGCVGEALGPRGGGGGVPRGGAGPMTLSVGRLGARGMPGAVGGC